MAARRKIATGAVAVLLGLSLTACEGDDGGVVEDPAGDPGVDPAGDPEMEDPAGVDPAPEEDPAAS